MTSPHKVNLTFVLKKETTKLNSVTRRQIYWMNKTNFFLNPEERHANGKIWRINMFHFQRWNASEQLSGCPCESYLNLKLSYIINNLIRTSLWLSKHLPIWHLSIPYYFLKTFIHIFNLFYVNEYFKKHLKTSLFTGSQT